MAIYNGLNYLDYDIHNIYVANADETGDRIDVYRIYSRKTVQYMAKVILTDSDKNQFSKLFPWHKLLSDEGEFLLKRAFEGRGTPAITVKAIENMHGVLKDIKKDGLEKELTKVGQSVSAPNELIKNQLEKWSEEAKTEGFDIQKIKDETNKLVDLTSQLEEAKNAVKEADEKERDNKKEQLKKIEDKLKVAKGKYELKATLVRGEADEIIYTAGVPILAKETKTVSGNELSILYISCEAYKEWLTALGVPYSATLKKMVEFGIMYNPSSTNTPRFHFTSNCGWYRGICMNNLDKLDLMV